MMMWVCFRSRNTSRWSPSVLFHTSNQVKLWTWSQINLESNKILFHSKLFWTNATFPLDVWNKCPTVCLNKMLTYPQAGLVWLCEVTRGQKKISEPRQIKRHVLIFFFTPIFKLSIDSTGPVDSSWVRVWKPNQGEKILLLISLNQSGLFQA